MFGVMINVHAEEKVLEVNFYEYENMEDMSDLENRAFRFVTDRYSDLFENEYIDHDDSYDFNLKYNGKRYYVGTFNYDTQVESGYFVLDDFNEDDSIELVLTDRLKEAINDDFDYSVLAYYDKIVLHFSNAPAPREVKIKKIELVERVGMAVINSPAKINGLNIDVDVKFKDVNDRVVYKALVKNNTDNDYYLTKGNINSTDEYIKYVFEYDGDEEIIKAGEEKEVTITLLYNKEVPATVLASGKYETTQVLGMTLTTEKEETVANPKTVDEIVKIVAILVISIALLLLMIKVQMIRKVMMIVLAVMIAVPMIAKAIEKINITINTNVEVTKNPSFAVYINDAKIPVYYEYEEGMTWEEWYDSDYNVDDIIVDVFYSSEYEACIVANGDFNNIDTKISNDPCSEYYGDVFGDESIGNLNQMEYYGYNGPKDPMYPQV
jgi:hypothetical protein